MALHFIGFRGQEYARAIRVFGKPDFIHVHFDARARDEIAPGDCAIFANKASPHKLEQYTRDDSAFF